MLVHREAVGDPEGPAFGIGDDDPAQRLVPHPQKRLLDGIVGLVIVQPEPPAQAEEVATAAIVDALHLRRTERPPGDRGGVVEAHHVGRKRHAIRWPSEWHGAG